MRLVPIFSHRRLLFVAFTVLAAGVALLPWWRNHQYLRDFMDYGLVMSAVAQIEAGLRPYTDFATPVQSATFWLNALAESLGGSYQAMTWGNAALILVALPLLAWLFARRWPLWAAIPVAWAIVAGSATQHTIIWYNSLGVLCLAAVAAAGALAPVLDRRQLALHAITAAALWLGGTNKLNFHLVALAIAFGWPLRAWLLGVARPGRIFATFAFIGVFGVALPLASELLWTGATPADWWHNVVGLPAARAGYFRRLTEAKSYLQPIHDYYGPLLIPQVGLASVALIVAAVGATLFRRAPLTDRFIAPVAGLLALGASLGLLATNHEIGYVALAAGLALAAALQLGFTEGNPRPARLALLLVLPAVCCGAAAGWSAWQGQRSQFGHSASARAEYRDCASANPELRYLAGTLVPPEFANSLAVAASIVPARNSAGLRPVLYGPGLEFLERVWPSTKTRGLPLWIAEGTTYGPRESALLSRHLGDPEMVALALTMVAWEQWPEHSFQLLRFNFVARECGSVARAYRRRENFEPPVVSLDLLHIIGGNLHPAFVRSGPWTTPYRAADGRLFLGSARSGTAFSFAAPSNRIAGSAIVQRLPDTRDGPVTVDLFVRYTRPDAPAQAWHQQVTLPQGVAEVSVDYSVDARQQPLDFAAEIPPEAAGHVAVGWLSPRIQHSQPVAGEPVGLRAPTGAGIWLDPAQTSLVPPGNWRPDAIFARAAVPAGDEFSVSAGGELWIRADRPLAEIRATLHLPDGSSRAHLPCIRLVWYKGGRLELLTQAPLRAEDGKLELRAWSAEPEGWIGILVDPGANTPDTLVRIDSAQLAN
ncbi:MAG: hypothetical protein QM691_05925 [Opitutaceae bacterium]